MSPANASPSKQSRHTRDDVASTALRILDDYGLPDLTMRRLAAALDVQPSALYWHFPNKQTLLAELADRITARGLVVHEPGEDWMHATTAEAASIRDALLAYRDGAELVSSTFALGLGASTPLVRLRSAVALGGFDDETADRASIALLHFVLGHVSHEQQRLQYESIGVAAGAPAASPLAGVDATAGPSTDDLAAFEFGVQLFIAGLGSSTRAHSGAS